jgi:two-component system response regulator (stage 0 sporulation protein A)
VIRVLQLDKDPLFLQAMNEYCSRLHDLQYEGVRDEAELFQLMRGQRPDLVLLDAELKQQGLQVLEKIRAKFPSSEVKVILISSGDASEQELAQTASLGADYFVQRPVDLIVLEKRIRQLLESPARSLPQALTRKQIQEHCTAFFEQMGIPPHYKGYRYLMEGIWLASVHPSWLNSVTQNLYPAIGQRFEVSGSQVERSMRYALDVTWEKGNLDQLYRFFPYVRENRGKPTNSAFIAKMVDLISLAASQSG